VAVNCACMQADTTFFFREDKSIFKMSLFQHDQESEAFMSNVCKAIPLWSDPLPGVMAAGQEQHERTRETPHLVPFLLQKKEPAPLVVVLPGGGYGWRTPHEANPVAEWLNSLGIHAVVCHYRVFPWRHPAPLMDAQRAVRIVRAHAADWRVDTARIGILGFSAGGHLACSVANFGDDGEAASPDVVARQSSRVNALIAGYPVISSGPFGHRGSFENLLGASPDPELLLRLSLENSVTPQNPPTFIFHSANDSSVPVENSLLYAQALSAAKVPFALHVYPNARHGVGLAQAVTGTIHEWSQACKTWFSELGWI